MLYQNNADSVAQAWQGQLDESLEAGEMLWLEGGLSRRTVDHLPLLLALDHFARRRPDLTSPGLLLGGDGVLWTTALLSQATAPGVSSVPALTLLYGGADQASYMAALTTLTGPSTHTRRYDTTGLPVGMQTQLLPGSQPGAALAWSSLPFVLAGQATTATGNGNGNERIGEPDTWLPWLTILVVIGLIITALFV